MKTLKITLLFAFSLFVLGAKAQILQNSLLLGGSMNFDYSSGKTTSTGPGTIGGEDPAPTTINFGLAPRFGYFIADNVALGLNLDFKINSTADDETVTTTRLITGPFVRVYAPMSDNIYAFGEVSFGGGIDSRSVVTGEVTDSVTVGGKTVYRSRPVQENVSVTNLQLGVGPGLNFFINEFVAFETLLKYTYGNSTYSFKTPTQAQVKSSTVSHNISLTLGLQVYLRAVTAGVRE
jgi:hypothetical protein